MATLAERVDRAVTHALRLLVAESGPLAPKWDSPAIRRARLRAQAAVTAEVAEWLVTSEPIRALRSGRHADQGADRQPVERGSIRLPETMTMTVPGRPEPLRQVDADATLILGAGLPPEVVSCYACGVGLPRSEAVEMHQEPDTVDYLCKDSASCGARVRAQIAAKGGRLA